MTDEQNLLDDAWAAISKAATDAGCSQSEIKDMRAKFFSRSLYLFARIKNLDPTHENAKLVLNQIESDVEAHFTEWNNKFISENEKARP